MSSFIQYFNSLFRSECVVPPAHSLTPENSVQIDLYWNGNSKVNDCEIHCLNIQMHNTKKKIEYFANVPINQTSEQQLEFYRYKKVEKDDYAWLDKKKAFSITHEVDTAKTMRVSAKVLTCKIDAIELIGVFALMKYEEMHIKQSKDILVPIEMPDFEGGKKYKLVVSRETDFELKAHFQIID